MRGSEAMGSMILEKAQKWVDEGQATGSQDGVARQKLENKTSESRNQ